MIKLIRSNLRPSRWFLSGLFVVIFAAASLSSSELTMPFPSLDLNKAHNPFSFIVYGDVQDVHENGHRKLVNQMEKETAALILNTGDISPNHGRNYDQHFLPEIRNLASRVPFFPAAGNHDVEFLCETSRNPYRTFFKNAYGFLAEQPFNQHLSEPENQRLWYAFRYASALFIALDSNLLIDSGRYRQTNLLPTYRNYVDQQVRWVKEVLEQSDSDPSIKSKFVFFHHSPFISKRNTAALGMFGGHEDDSPLLINSKLSADDGSFEFYLLDLFRRHRVNAVFTGHQHYYERWREMIDEGNGTLRSLNWIIVGSGGVKPRGNREYGDKEIDKLLSKGQLYDHYLTRISKINPNWNAKLERVYPNSDQHSGRIQDYLLVRVDGDEVRFQTTDTEGAIRDAGVLSP